MATPQLVRNVVFDIGWVLVRLNYRPLLDFLQAHGAELADRNLNGQVEVTLMTSVDDCAERGGGGGP